MKKIKIILSLFFVFIVNQLNAQILDSVYSDTNSIMKKAIGIVCCLNNYDNDTNYWTTLDEKYLLLHDKDLNNVDTIKIDSIPQNGYVDIFEHKYHNKLYSVSYSYENNKDTNIVYFSSYDLNTGAFISKQIPTSFKVFRCVETFTKNKEFAIAVSKRDESIAMRNPQIIILDTLGNIIRSNFISGVFQYHPLIEIGEYFALSNANNLYLVNKSTLEVVDSIDGKFIAAKAINDSILLGVYGYNHFEINIWNINSGERNTYKYIVDTTGFFALEFSIDFINPDSIYLAYRMTSLTGPGTDYFRIDNFGINGNFNFRYIFNELENGKEHYLPSITSSKDGGLILNIFSRLPQGGGAYGSIIKFMPRQVDSLFASISDSPIINNITCIAYPNPAKDNISFNCSSMINNIDIFNIMGERVYRADVKDKVKTIDISSLRKGMYIAKLYTERGIIDKKFIVE